MELRRAAISPARSAAESTGSPLSHLVQTLEWKQRAFSGLFCQAGIQRNVSAKAVQRVLISSCHQRRRYQCHTFNDCFALRLFFFFFIDLFSFCSSLCEMYCKAFAVSTKVTLMRWSIISKRYHSKATLFQHIVSNPAALSCCCCFFPPSHHCFQYHVCIYILGLKRLERSFVCQERFMICLMWSHNRRCSLIDSTWLWEKNKTRCSPGLHLAPV